MNKHILLSFGILASTAVMAEGIDCDTLPQWSIIDGYQVNQHHIFCGELNTKGKPVGFHSRPNTHNPSTYLSSSPDGGPNSAGVYKLKNIKLKLNGTEYVKTFSSMHPDHCTQAQVNKSVVYSYVNNIGQCADPNWAFCGPNAPANALPGGEYCVGLDGKAFEIATGVNKDTKEINTGFPIFKP